MPRPNNNRFIQSNDNLLIGSTDSRAVARQLRKLAHKQAQIEKRRQHLAYLLQEREAQLEMVNDAMEKMKARFVATSTEDV